MAGRRDYTVANHQGPTMSIIRCTQCDRPFDTDVEVEATYLPLPVCEDCGRDPDDEDEK